MALISKNIRGYSPATFWFMRRIIIPTSRYYCAPRMVNTENMPQTGPCFIFANHSNYYDPFLINDQMLTEPTAGVMTRYQFYHFLPRLFMGSIGVVPTSKYVPDPGVIRKVLGMIKQNRMIVIFPEGGRRWDGKPKSVIDSTFKMYWKMKIPVHPVQIHGSYISWPRWADYPRKNSTELHWQKPIHPSDYENYEEFHQHCVKTMDFDEYHPPESTLPKSAKKPAAGIQRFLYRCPVTGEPGAMYSPDGYKVLSKATNEFSYIMDKDSRLVDADGERNSLIEVYDHINTLPVCRDDDGYVIPETPCFVNRENEQRLLAPVGKGFVSMKADTLNIMVGSFSLVIPLEKLAFLSIEKNDKLMITHDGTTYLIDLKKTSALLWQHYYRRLKKGELAERKS